MERTLISTGTRWEPVVGYSRAVRVGPFVSVSGTTATGADGELVGAGDPYAQTVQTLRNIESALGRAGARLAHVVRTRISVLDLADREKLRRAPGQSRGAVRPRNSLAQV